MEYNADVKEIMREAGVRTCQIALNMGVSEHTLVEWLNNGGMLDGVKDAVYQAINKSIKDKK